MNADDFETRLQQQELREVPADWREEILRAAQDARAPLPMSAKADRPRRSLLSTLNSQLSTLLWPSPKAWGALAAAWLVIFAVRFSMREKPAIIAQQTNASSPEIKVVLEQQKRLLAKLLDWPPSPDVEQARPPWLRPHSERREEWQAA